MTDTISFIKFTKIRDIGNQEGKNSNVFLAIDDQLGDELVIKQMEKEKFNSDEYFSESKMIYASKHPNIVDIQYASQDTENIYLAMPHYDKGSLNNLATGRLLTVREIVMYSLDLLSAVSYIHSKGLLHLDIKPTNILIDVSGKAVLTDFGLSRYMDENGIADQPTSYSLHREPECYLQIGRTNQSDIYQIGLTIYRLCNGVEVLNQQLISMEIGTMDKLAESIKNGEFPDRTFFLPHVPKKLQKVILKALEVDPKKRYDNTISMMNDLSVIDDNLDWIYTGVAGNPYTKSNNSYQYDVFVTLNNDIECYKTNLISNKKTKISKCSIKCINENDLFKNLSAVVGGLN
ncbi:serine/threonine-protein kinase [Trichococcus shcherbakoviae]|uniref:serine/threonine-protein kinase n=1 Tax=Trichococcus shcherbakoviae TaxID=2094020 RepID=UPI002AA858E8|nr:serine/threonine-protein kinase [Trichococcus shcherbakoviae]